MHLFQIFTTMRTLLGPKIFEMCFRPLVYNIFIAGDNTKDIMESMKNIEMMGLKPLLSPMLEDDPEEDGKQR